MNNNQFKEFLCTNARIMDKSWNPSDEQLDRIRILINNKIRSEERIGYIELQNIIINVCGSMRVMVTSSVDNSDLNALLIAAMKK